VAVGVAAEIDEDKLVEGRREVVGSNDVKAIEVEVGMIEEDVRATELEGTITELVAGAAVVVAAEVVVVC
jgi:hypothetical protein